MSGKQEEGRLRGRLSPSSPSRDPQGSFRAPEPPFPPLTGEIASDPGSWVHGVTFAHTWEESRAHLEVALPCVLDFHLVLKAMAREGGHGLLPAHVQTAPLDLGRDVPRRVDAIWSETERSVSGADASSTDLRATGLVATVAPGWSLRARPPWKPHTRQGSRAPPPSGRDW